MRTELCTSFDVLSLSSDELSIIVSAFFSCICVIFSEEPEVRSPPMMKAPKAGMPGGMPGMGGLLAEMKQKRKTMHPAAVSKPTNH